MSTLKRMWQYVHSEHMPRESTLSVLARFAGYNDWAHFCREHDDWSDSGFLSTINVETDMSVGEEITLTWKPDRSLRIRHLSGTRFEVLDATHCKLQRGDTFCASWISNGCPLLATRVMRASLSLPDYIAGKKEGIRIVEEVTKAEP